jgi:ABC-type cobalamin/Fe3+-siderophores transport system ATPase subunit
VELTLTGISYVRREKAILSNLSAVVPNNGLTCLLGTNGAGKTTLLRILSGELKSTSGRYYIGDIDASALSQRELAKYFAIIPQNAPIPPYLTVREMVALGRFQPRGFSKWHLSIRDRAIIDACLARCQIDKLGDRRLDELSGGEQKRAWLALGLAPDKKIIMLDETLEGMDIFVKRTFFQLLKDIASQDKSILLTSHDLDMVNQFADKIIVLIGGKVIFQGPPDSDLRRLLSDTTETAQDNPGNGG